MVFCSCKKTGNSPKNDELDQKIKILIIVNRNKFDISTKPWNFFFYDSKS